MTESSPETDGRWRRLRVSNDLLSVFFRGHAEPAGRTDAPADLCVVGLNEVAGGPNGNMVFIIWSASFEPLPMNDEGRLLSEIPFVEFTYWRVQP